MIDFRLVGTLSTMNSKCCLFVLAAFAVAALSVPAFLSPTQQAPVATMDDSMQSLQAGFKGLEKALGKGEVEKALRLVVDMQNAAQEAKTGLPEKSAEIADGAERTKFLNAYRLKIVDLQRALLDVEVALVEGKLEDAKKLLDTKLKPLKKEGHDTFKD